MDVLQQVMCTHDTEALAIAVLEIFKGESESKRDRQTEIRRVK